MNGKDETNDSDVLIAKFDEADALVKFYEATINKLRSVIHLRALHGSDPAQVRRDILDFTEGILTTGFATSLIAADHASAVKNLGKRYARSVREAYAHWEQQSTAAVGLDEKASSADEERHVLLAVGCAMLNVFSLGLRPVRQIRDDYVARLKPKTARRLSRRGRTADPNKPGRDRQILAEYESLSGKPGRNREKLADQYDLSPETIRKIVSQAKAERQKSGN